MLSINISPLRKSYIPLKPYFKGIYCTWAITKILHSKVRVGINMIKSKKVCIEDTYVYITIYVKTLYSIYQSFVRQLHRSSRRISLLLTLVLSFSLGLCNNKDILPLL